MSPLLIARFTSARMASRICPCDDSNLSVADVESALAQRGASEGVVRDMIETMVAVSDGIYDADQARAIPGPTDFRTWCREVLRPATQ